MKSYSSRELISKLQEDGWYLVNSVGDHHQFKHPIKKGKVTSQKRHPGQDIEKYRETVRSYILILIRTWIKSKLLQIEL